MQIFISQPMRDLTDMEVYAVRNKICEKFHITEDELIDNYTKKVPKEDVNQAAWCLGDSIRLMAFADLVIFAPGWKEARGCYIEHDVCEDYRIHHIDLYNL